MRPMSPQAALKELRRESQTASPAQTGLAIASLAVGVLVAMSAVPAGILLAEKAAPTLVSLVAFACIALVMGIIGRKNSMGVAGLALAGVALVETVSVYGYISHQAELDRLKEVSIQQEKTAQERQRAERAEAELRIAEEKRLLADILFQQNKKKLEAETAEANARKAKIETEEKIRRESNEKVSMEQQAIIAEAQARAAEDERVLQQWKYDSDSKKNEEERKASAQHEVALRKRADRSMILKMTSVYQQYFDEYKRVSLKVTELRAQRDQAKKDAKNLESRISNTEHALNRLIQSGDGPQREKLQSEIQRLSAMQQKAQNSFSYQEIPETVEYDISPDSSWRNRNWNRQENREYEEFFQTYRRTGDNFATLHRALRGAIKEYPYDGSTGGDLTALLASGAQLLAPSSKPRSQQEERLPTIRLLAAGE